MDILADILTVTRLAGNVARLTYCDPPWGIRFDAFPKVWFHIVAAGNALLLPARGKPLALGPFDLVVLPHGSGHAIADTPTSPQLTLEGWHARKPRARSDRPRTELVCGSYTVAFAEIHPVLRLLPGILHVPGPEVRSSALQPTIDLLLRELSERDVGSERVVSRILEVMFVHVLRHWLDINAGKPTGWLGALRDEPIGRALVALHTTPARDWTVAALAREVGMSRPVFARRFTAKVGETPLGYLRKLRLDLATVALTETDQPLAAVAAQVGYTSEYAFNRAFQRARGEPPGRYRKQLRSSAA